MRRRLVDKAVEGEVAGGARRRPGRPRKEVDELSSVQLQRLATLEMMALWGGQVRRRDLMRAFDLSDGQVTQTIGLYRRLVPSNLEVDPDTRAWRPSERFSPKFIQGDTSEYLKKIFASRVAEVGNVGAGYDVPTSIVPVLPANLPRDTVGQIVFCILSEAGIFISYQSLDSEEPTSRTIWPHALVNTGYRWLVRCFDGKHGRFADLALARVLSTMPSDKKCDVASRDDDLWNTMLCIKLRPLPELSASQRAIVCRDYGFPQDSYLDVNMRASMLQYFLDFYDLRPGQRSKRSFLEIVNFKDVSQYDRDSSDEK